jgi:hypothetical protein
MIRAATSYSSIRCSHCEEAVKVETPKRIATIGGILLSVSGVVNAVLGARIGALVYDTYPGGKMGHVGVLVGLLAIVIGHAGAVAGAIYIGTVGVVLCYAAGIWVLIAAVRGIPAEDSGSQSNESKAG